MGKGKVKGKLNSPKPFKAHSLTPKNKRHFIGALEQLKDCNLVFLSVSNVPTIIALKNCKGKVHDIQYGMLVKRTFMMAPYKIVRIKMLQKWQIGQSIKKPFRQTPCTLLWEI